MQQLHSLIQQSIYQKIISASAIESVYQGNPFVSMYLGTSFFSGLIQDKTPQIINDASIFDISSLTKVLATMLITAKLIDTNIISLQTSVAEILDEYAINFKKELGNVSIKQLLCHTSGLNAWEQLYGVVDNKSNAYLFVRTRPLQYQAGTQHIYSDLGYILLGEIIELIMQAKLNDVFLNHIAQPLALYDIFYINSDSNIDKNLINFVSTGYSPQRDKTLLGEVHDENTYVMGGVSGHAGLFSTAKNVSTIAQHILDIIKDRVQNPLVSKNTLLKMFEPYSLQTTWACGMHYPDKDRGISAAGSFMSANSLGMTGFTGTSLWIDFDQDIVITALCNRTISEKSAKFGGEKDAFTRIRPIINDIIIREI